LHNAFLVHSSERQVKKFRHAYLQAILRQDVGWFDKTGTGELTTRISGDMILIQQAIGDKLGTLLQFEFTFLGGFAVGFWRGWELTLVLLAVTPLLGIAGGLMMKVMTMFSSKGQSSYEYAGAIAQESLSNMRTIASFSGEEIQSEKYNSQLHIARKIGIKKGFISGLSIGSTMGIMFLAYSLALYVGALWISDPTKSYTTGKVLEVFFAVVMGAFALGQASPGITALSLGQAAAFKAFETINRVPTIDSYSEEGTVLKKLKEPLK